MPPNHFYNKFDLARLEPSHSSGDYRSPFQVDRDRILHTSAFRRLQSKTQVFWSGQFDFYRTRLTHSLEVAQIGRSICNHLLHSSDLLTPDCHIDPELVEAACLAHDLGHPPFGHAGERSLNQLMLPHGGFEGNAQTLRLLTATIYSNPTRGINPTRALLDAILKYKSLHGELNSPTNHFIYTDQSPILDFTLDHNDFPPELTPGKHRNQFRSIECQIMDWADDTAYSLNDLADGIQCGFLNIERIERWASQQTPALDDQQTNSITLLLKAIRQHKIEAFLGRRIGHYIQASSLQPTSNFMSPHSRRYQFKLSIDPTYARESQLFKQIAYQIIFQAPSLKQLEFKADFMLKRLFNALADQYLCPKQAHHPLFPILPDPVQQLLTPHHHTTPRARILCDYLATLTDPQATRIYQRLFNPNDNSITDPIH